MFESVLANVAQELLHLWDFNHSSPTESVEIIIGEGSRSEIAANPAVLVVRGKACVCHGSGLHPADTCSECVFFAQSAGNDLLEIHAHVAEKAREAFEKGWKLLYEKSAPEKSLAQFQRAIDQYPPYYEAYAQTGVADYRLARFSEAEKALRRSIEISAEKYPDALFLLAQMLNDQERFKEAEPPARQAIVAGDASWHGHFELARALVGLKRGAEAEASARRAKELKPDNPQVYLVLANAHIQQQKISSVVQDFDEYLKLEPNAPGSDQIRQRRDRMREGLQRAQPTANSPKP
jgi:tetratricopeptide (TPR) repeat protein